MGFKLDNFLELMFNINWFSWTFRKRQGLVAFSNFTKRLLLIPLFCCCSVTQPCPSNPVDCSMPGFPVLNYLPEHAQTRWCHPTTSSSVAPFLSCLQSLPASGSFPMSWLLATASASVLPMNIQGWFPLGLTGLISLLSKGLSRVFSSAIVVKNQFFGAQPSLWSNSHICTWLLEKP